MGPGSASSWSMGTQHSSKLISPVCEGALAELVELESIRRPGVPSDTIKYVLIRRCPRPMDRRWRRRRGAIGTCPELGAENH